MGILFSPGSFQPAGWAELVLKWIGVIAKKRGALVFQAKPSRVMASLLRRREEQEGMEMEGLMSSCLRRSVTLPASPAHPQNGLHS